MPPRVGLGPLPANDEYKAFGSAPSAEEALKAAQDCDERRRKAAQQRPPPPTAAPRTPWHPPLAKPWTPEPVKRDPNAPKEENIWERGAPPPSKRCEAIRGALLGLPTTWAPRCVEEACDKREKMVCTGCRRIRYCCRAQQREHWTVHRVYCRRDAPLPGCATCAAGMEPADVRHTACCGREWCRACASKGRDAPCPFCGAAGPSLDADRLASLKVDDDETDLEVALRRGRAWLFPLMRLIELVARWRLGEDPACELAKRHVGAVDEATRRWDPPRELQNLAIEVGSWVDGIVPGVPADLARLVPDSARRALQLSDGALALRFKAACAGRIGPFVDAFVAQHASADAEHAQACEGARLAGLAAVDALGAAMPAKMRTALETRTVA